MRKKRIVGKNLCFMLVDYLEADITAALGSLT